MKKVLLYSVPPPADGDKRAAAIIAAAGDYTRMNGINKQFALLDGVPVIAHAVKAFQQADSIREIVIAAKREDIPRIADICREYGFSKVSAIAEGGRTRQQSVLNGIRCVQADTRYFAVHDGARPLVKPELIDKVVRHAWEYGAAVAAAKCKDTVKKADTAGFVEETPDRRSLWIAQTPQVFESGLYIRAAESAEAAREVFTDDSQLIERLGHRVFLVEGDYENIKITTPEDILVAECIIKSRKEFAAGEEG